MINDEARHTLIKRCADGDWLGDDSRRLVLLLNARLDAAEKDRDEARRQLGRSNAVHAALTQDRDRLRDELGAMATTRSLQATTEHLLKQYDCLAKLAVELRDLRKLVAQSIAVFKAGRH